MSIRFPTFARSISERGHIGLKPNNFFDKYSMHPLSGDLSRGGKIAALTATVALGILTLGLFHLVHACTHVDHDFDPNHLPPIAKRTDEIVSEEFEEDSPVSSEEAEESHRVEIFSPLALHDAVNARSLEDLKHAIQGGVDIFTVDASGKTAYSLAEESSDKALNKRLQKELIHALLGQYGYSPDSFSFARDYHPHAFLCEIIDRGCEELIDPLLRLGVDFSIDSSSLKHYTPFMHAEKKGKQAIQEKLIRHVISQAGYEGTYRQYNKEMIFEILHNGDTDLLIPLAKLGLEFNVETTRGVSPYHYAKKESPERAQKLIQAIVIRYGYTLDSFDQYNEQLLESVIEKGDEFLFKSLVGVGLARKISPKSWETLYQAAKKHKHPHIEQEILRGRLEAWEYNPSRFKHFDGRILIEAVKMRDYNLIGSLVDFGVDLFAKDAQGKTAYRIILDKKDPKEWAEIIINKLLRDHNYDPNTFRTIKDKILFEVIDRGYENLIEPLAKLGLNLNVQPISPPPTRLSVPFNGAPIHFAMATGQYTILAELIKAGAEIYTELSVLIYVSPTYKIPTILHLVKDISTPFQRKIFLDALLNLPEEHRKRFLGEEHSKAFDYLIENAIAYLTEEAVKKISPLILAMMASLNEYDANITKHFSHLTGKQAAWVLEAWKRKFSQELLLKKILEANIQANIGLIFKHLSDSSKVFYAKTIFSTSMEQCKQPSAAKVLEEMTAMKEEAFNQLKVKELVDKKTTLLHARRPFNTLSVFTSTLDQSSLEEVKEEMKETLTEAHSFLQKQQKKFDEALNRIKGRLLELEKLRAKENVESKNSVVDDEDTDISVYLGTLGVRYKADYVSKLGLPENGETFAIPSQRGITEVADLHALGLSNALIYIIDQADEASVKKEIDAWWEKEGKQIEDLQKIIEAKELRVFITTIEGYVENETKYDQKFLDDLKQLDRDRRVACLRSYLNQKGIEKLFTDEKSLKDLEVKSYLELYQLRII